MDVLENSENRGGGTKNIRYTAPRASRATESHRVGASGFFANGPIAPPNATVPQGQGWHTQEPRTTPRASTGASNRYRAKQRAGCGAAPWLPRGQWEPGVRTRDRKTPCTTEQKALVRHY
jgi:hypothetical protein